MATALNTPESTRTAATATQNADNRVPANTGFFEMIGDLALTRKRQRDQAATTK